MVHILVCGGRAYDNAEFLNKYLSDFDAVYNITEVIHGGSFGADLLAHKWAKKHKKKLSVFKADWETDGKAAGPIRNRRMLDEGSPDFVIVFPGGKGTADMVRYAQKKKVRVVFAV